MAKGNPNYSENCLPNDGATTRRSTQRPDNGVHVFIPWGARGGRAFFASRGRFDQDRPAVDGAQDVVPIPMESFAREQNGVSEGLGTFGSHEGQGGSARNSNDMPVHITIHTQKEAFKHLIGRGGKNLEKIKNESWARIVVEDYRKAGAIQHAFISGRIENVIADALKVKESLERYRPERDGEQSAMQNPFNGVYLMSIRADAVVKINPAAAGHLIGQKGENIKRIMKQTGVEHPHVDNEVVDGFKDLHLRGDATSVLKAIQQVRDLMKEYPGSTARSDEISTRSDERIEVEVHPAPNPQPTDTSTESTKVVQPASTTAFPPMTLPPNMASPPTLQPVQLAQPMIVRTQDGQMVVLVPNENGTCTPHLLPKQPTVGSHQSAGQPVFPVPGNSQLPPQNAGPPGFPALDTNHLSQNALPRGRPPPAMQQLSGMPDEGMQMANQQASAQPTEPPMAVYGAALNAFEPTQPRVMQPAVVPQTSQATYARSMASIQPSVNQGTLQIPKWN